MDFVTKCQKIGDIKFCITHIIIITILSIFIYGYVARNYIHNDPLEKKFAKCSGCDWWAITHALLFMFIGYLYPKHLLEIVIIGVCWEFIETFIGTRKIMLFNRRIKLVGEIDAGISNDNAWWYGRVSDVAFDALGAVIGQRLYMMMNNI